MLEALAYALFGLFLLMVPGFLFMLVLYPRLGSLDFWERMGGSLGLGVLLLIYVGFVIAQPGLKMLEAWPFIGAVSVLCVVLGFLAYLRGGFGVITAYGRAVFSFFRKFRSLKPPEQPQPQRPEERPEQPPEQRGEEN